MTAELLQNYSVFFQEDPFEDMFPGRDGEKSMSEEQKETLTKVKKFQFSSKKEGLEYLLNKISNILTKEYRDKVIQETEVLSTFYRTDEDSPICKVDETYADELLNLYVVEEDVVNFLKDFIKEVNKEVIDSSTVEVELKRNGIEISINSTKIASIRDSHGQVCLLINKSEDAIIISSSLPLEERLMLIKKTAWELV